MRKMLKMAVFFVVSCFLISNAFALKYHQNHCDKCKTAKERLACLLHTKPTKDAIQKALEMPANTITKNKVSTSHEGDKGTFIIEQSVHGTSSAISSKTSGY